MILHNFKFDPDDENDLINKIKFYLENKNINLNLITQNNRNYVIKNYSFPVIKNKLNVLYDQYF